MRFLITTIVAIPIALLFSGCGQCVPQINTVYVKSKVARLKTLNKVEPYTLNDVKSFDDTHYIIPKEDLEKASSVSKKRIRIINFYEKQNMKFNSKFSNI